MSEDKNIIETSVKDNHIPVFKKVIDAFQNVIKISCKRCDEKDCSHCIVCTDDRCDHTFEILKIKTGNYKSDYHIILVTSYSQITTLPVKINGHIIIKTLKEKTYGQENTIQLVIEEQINIPEVIKYIESKLNISTYSTDNKKTFIKLENIYDGAKNFDDSSVYYDNVNKDLKIYLSKLETSTINFIYENIRYVIKLTTLSEIFNKLDENDKLFFKMFKVTGLLVPEKITIKSIDNNKTIKTKITWRVNLIAEFKARDKNIDEEQAIYEESVMDPYEKISKLKELAIKYETNK
ncbi:unknown similar to AMEV140 [Adoxophyes honmai entomopoxvirus 'L']|uniref:Uncharacterized protein n=1 Tax=Adoxophyes honmai entomopoxvirus 'L' TaxID=1293540 RepID=A0A916KPB1_9POXV|nr:unknown similar to AMEV140 [Adoxophyes honmai entomopoxvirus 'L']CCU55507.1 unknown similar to AMEV140 [Adoxophyes honmai entomopoxvirus 'L']